MVTTRVMLLATAAFLLAATTATAQMIRETLPVIVVDARAGNAGMPTEQGWTPAVPLNTEVPARTLGFEFGAHFYPLRRAWGGLGVGGSLLFARGKTTPIIPEGGTRPPGVPDVETRVQGLLPQLSLNFGHRLGWSYISAGLGRTRVESTATSTASSPALSTDSLWVGTIHFGGGARWFVNDHFGISFDLRWNRLPNVAETGAAKTRLFTATAGISLK